MFIAKAYQMLLGAHPARQADARATFGTMHGVQEPWLSAGIYRAVSRTADLFGRLGGRSAPRR